MYFVTECPSSLSPKVYYCRSLAIAFIEHTVLQRYHDYTHDTSVPVALQPVLRNLSALYGLWSLSKHLTVLYQGEINSLICCACHFYKVLIWPRQGILAMIYVRAFSYCLFNIKQPFSTKFSGAGICSEKLTQKALFYLRDNGEITSFAVIQCLCERMRGRQHDAVV